jgi:hypothetical protein
MLNPFALHIQVDILLSVVDNYGDMGFALELIYSLEYESPDIYSYIIWTDNIIEVERFFSYQTHLPSALIFWNLSDFGRIRLSSLALALFHIEIPGDDCFAQNSLVLRIDYLSLDPEWARLHGSEHIRSTPYHRVIEIIPSPLVWWAGILSPLPHSITRTELAEKYDIDPWKQWISLFTYPDTRENLIFDISDDTMVLVFASWREMIEREGNVLYFPMIAATDLYSFFTESIWIIVRWEVSVAQALHIWRPFFWDMYQSRGGFPREQSELFLQNIGDSEYSRIHNCLNRLEWGVISLSQMRKYVQKCHQFPLNQYIQAGSLGQEIKKYIDRSVFLI